MTLADVTYLLYEWGIMCWVETLFHYQADETVKHDLNEFPSDLTPCHETETKSMGNTLFYN